MRRLSPAFLCTFILACTIGTPGRGDSPSDESSETGATGPDPTAMDAPTSEPASTSEPAGPSGPADTSSTSELEASTSEPASTASTSTSEPASTSDAESSESSSTGADEPICDTGLDPQMLSLGHDYASQIASDGTSIFWTDRTGEIWTLLDGLPTTIASGHDYALGIDADDDNVAWTTSHETGGIFLATKDGTQVTQIAAGQDRPWRVALDATHAYWVNTGPNFQSSGAVMRVGRNGAGLTALATNQVYPLDLAINETDVFYVSYGTGVADGALLRVAKTGGPTSTFASNLAYPSAVTVDSTHVYWTASDGIWKMSLLGGPKTLLSGEYAGDILIDGNDLFFTAFNSGWVRRTSIQGGPVITLATGQAEPYGITADSTAIYWTTLGDERKNIDGTVMKICR